MPTRPGSETQQRLRTGLGQLASPCLALASPDGIMSGFLSLFFGFFFFWVVLRFEFKALCLQGRCSRVGAQPLFALVILEIIGLHFFFLPMLD
jgi:hypothetical protein